MEWIAATIVVQRHAAVHSRRHCAAPSRIKACETRSTIWADAILANPHPPKRTKAKSAGGLRGQCVRIQERPVPLLSIVLSHSQLWTYQLIFRLVFVAKYVERQLVGMWPDHQLRKAMVSLRSAFSCSPTFSLRRRMLHFIQNFVYYTKFDVIEPNWREFERKLNATKEYCSNSKKSKGDDDNMILNGQFPLTVDDLLHGHNVSLKN